MRSPYSLMNPSCVPEFALVVERLVYPLCVDGIVSHLKKQAGPASVEVQTAAEFHKFVGDRDASIVGK